MEISKEKFLKLPESAGVYTFWKGNIPIYIGKSINLKSRLNSYLDSNLLPKTQQMVNEADKVTYIIVSSDLESLLLESQQIKLYKPKYNILLKDDKHPLYVVITDEEFPRVVAVRKSFLNVLKTKAEFGPFPSTQKVKEILKMIRKIFPFSDHKITNRKVIKKPCLYSHLGLCNPCPNKILSYINKPQLDENEEILIKEMSNQYKQNIKNIKLVLSRKFNIVRNNLEKIMLSLSSSENFEEAKVIRDKIKLLDYITQEKIDTNKFLENPNLIDDIRNNELNTLINFLNSSYFSSIFQINSLKRIECFDIAHISGVSATASMVVAINGILEKSEYKHFKIKQTKSQSDYDSMKEIVQRRQKHLEDWGRPDLIIVDGGLGQVKIFNDVFKHDLVPVVGIAKNPDRIVFPSGLKIKLTGDMLRFVSRIRDEAHRFARRLHHKLFEKYLTGNR